MSLAGGAADMATDDPDLFNQTGADSSSNQKGVPVPWWTGIGWRALTWIVPDTLNAKGQPGTNGDTIKKKAKLGSYKVGKKYRASVAGIAGLGLADSLHAIEINKKIVWPANGEPDPVGLTRNDAAAHTANNPDSPYWRLTIPIKQDGITSTFYIYWGRADQPADNTVLAKWAALGQRHPAYRGQVLCCVENYYFGRNITSVPSTRLLLRRSPQPPIGDFPTLKSPQGESLPASILELLTHPIHGAGIPTTHFNPAQWQQLSRNGADTGITQTIGCHSPELLRAVPIRDAVKQFLAYYDGWLTLRQGIIVPGAYPHKPDKLAVRGDIQPGDLTKPPRITTTPPAQAANAVTVNYRDKDAKLIEASTTATDAAAIHARATEQPVSMDMPAIIDTAQANTYAARAAATSTSAQTSIQLTLRSPRASLNTGTRIQPGDTADFTYPPLSITQKYCRVTKRTDAYRGAVSIELAAEHGHFATLPAITAPVRPPPAGDQLPDPVAAAHIIELPRSNFSPSFPAQIAFLIRRPSSHAASNPAYTGDAVSGTRILHATPGASSYDLLDDLDAWAASARLTAALPAASDTAEVIEASLIFDADNLDLALYESQSPAQQSNNALLLVVENEILSVGTITPDSQNPLRRTLTLLRGRLGTQPVQHAANAEAWLIDADELTPLSHADYLPDTDRSFKLIPYTAAALLPAEDATPIPFHFAALPPSNEAPEIVFATVQTSVPAGASLTVPATVTAKDADIKTLQATLIALDAHGTDGPGQTLLASSAREDQRAFWPLSLLATCPVPGDYVVEIRVTNLAGVEFAERSPVITAGDPLPNYSWGEFLPTLGSATEVYTYTTRNGRWDSRGGWLRLHMRIVVPSSTGKDDSNDLVIDLTDAGIPQSAWPDVGQEYWGTARCAHITSQDADDFQPVLRCDGDRLTVMFYHSHGMTALKFQQIGNSSDGPTMLDATWMLPDPCPKIANPMPYFAPTPPNLVFADSVRQDTSYTVSRTYTVKAPYGTLAGCKIEIQVFGSYSVSNGQIFYTKTFTAADETEATFTLNRTVSGGTPGATYQYWFRLILTSAGGQTTSYTGPKFKWSAKG